MSNFLNVAISRRSLIKFGAVSGALLAMPFWGNNAIAQSTSGNAPKAVETKPEGLVSFNAGWAIPLEDKSALLSLEQKKIKEAQAATSQAGPSSAAGSDNLAKPTNKNWKDKAQDAWSRVKSFF